MLLLCKVQRLNRRKEWLRSNELLLRTFLSYCSLHSAANGAGLNSVKMELVLLMQELVEDRSMKQLLTTIPVPTSIPLLAASLASSKSMVAGPIKMIMNLATDILSSVVSMGANAVPVIFDHSLLIATVKEASVSLSACIYQCLCDRDALTVSENAVNTGMQGFSRNILYKSSYLISGMKKKATATNTTTTPASRSIVSVKSGGANSNPNPSPNLTSECSSRVFTSPKSWPGISNLNKLLEREQDTEAPKLKILLFESLVAVYSSLLLNAFVFYDCSSLWRLLSKQWTETMWSKLFGGGCQVEYRYRAPASTIPCDDENAKQRMKINARLGHKLSSFVPSSSPPNGHALLVRNNSSSNNPNPSSNGGGGGEEKVYSREYFVAPEISMINFFLNKPESWEKGSNSGGGDEEEYDSDEDQILDQSKRDVLDEEPEIVHGKRYSEHVNPKSYSWYLMRYAILKYSILSITSFLATIGVEVQEIAVLSPLIHQIIKTFENWMELLLIELKNSFSAPPDDYIPNCSMSSANFNFSGPKILKYQSMLDPANTPFMNDKSTYPVRRLWHFLVTKKPLHDTFIRHIFRKKSNVSSNLANIYVISFRNLSAKKILLYLF